MPNVTNLTLKNAADADVTFVAQQQSQNSVLWYNKTSTEQALFKSLRLTQLLSEGQRPNNRLVFELRDPKLVTDIVTDSKSIPYALARVEFVFPPSLTSTERADALSYVSSMLGTQSIKDVIEDLDFFV